MDTRKQLFGFETEDFNGKDLASGGVTNYIKSELAKIAFEKIDALDCPDPDLKDKLKKQIMDKMNEVFEKKYFAKDFDEMIQEIKKFDHWDPIKDSREEKSE